MSTDSPLFQSSLELLGHAVTHFNAGGELDRKLVILHLANAVELLLKDMVLNSGASIYKNPKETISVHGCLSELEKSGVSLPYLNKIELLVDERNALQHRFGSPNELTSIFYTDIAIEFFREVLKDQYGLELDSILSEYVPSTDWHAFTMRIPNDENELDNLKRLANVHPLGAMLSATAYLEKIINSFSAEIAVDRMGGRRPFGMITHRILTRLGVDLPVELNDKLDLLRQQRNLAAHGRQEPTKEDVVKGVEAVSEFERFLSGLNIVEVKAHAEALIATERSERLAHAELLESNEK